MRIRVRAGDRELELSAPGELTVGRHESCTVQLSEPVVSGVHAVLRTGVDGEWMLADQDSSGGTWRGNDRVEQVAVDGPLEVRLGDPVVGPLVELTPVADDGEPAHSVEPAADREAPLRTRIGRDPDNDVVLSDLLVSRQHAELRQRGEEVELVDLGSRNGTFVNGRRVQRAVLDELDLVAIGHTLFRAVGGRLEEYVETGAVTFEASGVTVAGPEQQTLVDDVSFALTECALLAVVGPSGSGKSTLLQALAGLRPADAGTVAYAGRDLYGDYEELRNRIGFVPQEDILHRELTVRRAVEYAGRLRFPADVTAEERRARIDEVLDELGITHRGDVRIDQLSGGERKRVSVALELLTTPSLLFLDEPVAGLDPGLARSLMQLLRALADAGRTIVVVTHDVASLRLCDQVLVLAPGGVPAYVGLPQFAPAHFEREELTEVFADLAADPSRDWRYAGRPARPDPQGSRAPPAISPPPPQQSWWSQLRTLTARSAEVLVADRRNLGLLLAQAPLLGLLMLAALPPGELAAPEPSEVRFVSTAGLVLFVLLVGATWLGANNAIREIASELAVLRRERAVGLSLSAYVTAKSLVLGTLTVAQAVVLTALAIARQGGPDSAVLLGWGPGELALAVALAGLAAMGLGLLVSALAGSPDRATSILPILLIVQLVLSAGVVLPEIVDRPGLRELSNVASAQWGVAAAAATVDLNELQQFGDRLRELREVDAADPVPVVEALLDPADPASRWAHTPRAWLTAVGALVALTLVPIVAASRVLRRYDPGR